MTVDKLIKRAQVLEERIQNAAEVERYELHQQLHRTLVNIQQNGGQVPARLKRLDLEMLEDEIEDGFDNMPI
ncbi:hypothetical protein [Shimia sp.]|uniref:hypothetical protein n=1 Tax=Shimia sp. TaxID=1954381 RepID=UPI003B8B9D4A